MLSESYILEVGDNGATGVTFVANPERECAGNRDSQGSSLVMTLSPQSTNRWSKTNRTILVTDLEDFTGFKVQYGADSADAVLEKHDEIVVAIVKKYKGQILKSTGDGFLCWFDTEDSAIIAAVRMQQSLFEYNQLARTDEQRIPGVKIAISSGPVIERMRADQTDLLGVTVDKTFRICSATNGNHIIVQGDKVQPVETLLKGNYQDGAIFNDVRVETRGELLWKGGRDVPTSILEVRYTRRNALIPPQTEFLLGPDLVYDKVDAINMAKEMVLSAKDRLLIALRTLPVLTGPNTKEDQRETKADEDLENALKGRLYAIANQTDPACKIRLVYSGPDSKKYIQRLGDGQIILSTNVRFLSETKSLAGERMNLLRARSLQTAMLIADKKVAIWTIYEAKGIAPKGFGIRIVSPDISSKLWDKITEICDPEETDYGRYSEDLLTPR